MEATNAVDYDTKSYCFGRHKGRRNIKRFMCQGKESIVFRLLARIETNVVTSLSIPKQATWLQRLIANREGIRMITHEAYKKEEARK